MCLTATPVKALKFSQGKWIMRLRSDSCSEDKVTREGRLFDSSPLPLSPPPPPPSQNIRSSRRRIDFKLSASRMQVGFLRHWRHRASLCIACCTFLAKARRRRHLRTTIGIIHEHIDTKMNRRQKAGWFRFKRASFHSNNAEILARC